MVEHLWGDSLGATWMAELSDTIIGASMLEFTNSEVRMYPNPTRGQITIDLGGVKAIIRLSLTNTLGQFLLTKDYASTSLIKLDLEVPKGLYFLRLESNGEVITNMIIKE